RDAEVPAIAAQDDGLRGGTPGPRPGPAWRPAGPRGRSRRRPHGHILQREARTPRGPGPGGAELDAPDVARAHRSVPGGLDPAGVVRGDAVVLAVVDQHIGIGNAGRRTVQVVDGRGPVGHAIAVVAVEPGVDPREIHRL